LLSGGVPNAAAAGDNVAGAAVLRRQLDSNAGIRAARAGLECPLHRLTEAAMPQALTMDAESLKKYRTWFMIYGVVFVILGGLAIAMPYVATLAVELTVGWLLVIGGVLGVIACFSSGQSAPGFWWNLLLAVLYLLAGIALLWHPVAGVVTLTIILVAYLIAGGVSKIVMALGMRSALPKAWGWMLFSGLVDLALAALILSGWPGSAGWVIGLLVGVNLLMTGVALTIAATHAKDVVQVTVRTA
jgi:uncharacterized membrane protein HdeD (DUF308 family)